MPIYRVVFETYELDEPSVVRALENEIAVLEDPMILDGAVEARDEHDEDEALAVWASGVKARNQEDALRLVESAARRALRNRFRRAVPFTRQDITELDYDLDFHGMGYSDRTPWD